MNFINLRKNILLSALTVWLALAIPSFAIEDFMPPIPNDEQTVFENKNTPVPKDQNQNIKPEKNRKTKNTPVISAVKIEGNKIIKNSEIMNAMKMKVGDVYSPESIQKDLTELYNTGWFTEKMKAIPVKDENNNIVLKVYVEENRPITEFMITGNNVVSSGEIEELLSPLENQPQNLTTLNAAVEKVEELYSSKA